MKLALAADARADIRGILMYSRQEWGDARRDRYREELERVFSTLVAHPEIGRERAEIGRGVRTFPVGSHLVVYRVTKQYVRVLRVVHQNRDLTRVL